jgi:hypothetical protein
MKTKKKKPPIYKRGDVREDGYIFKRYQTHRNGKTYPVFMSPLAKKMESDRAKKPTDEQKLKRKYALRAWRLRNPEKVKAYRIKYNKPKSK